MKSYLDNLVAFWDMSTVNPVNLAKKTYGINNCVSFNIDKSNIVDGLAGGKGLELNNGVINEYLSVANNKTIDFKKNESFSVFFWMVGKDDIHFDSIFTKIVTGFPTVGNTGAYGYDFLSRGDHVGNELNFRIRDTDDSSLALVGSTDVCNGFLHFVTGVVDRESNLMKLYVDGSKDASDADISGYAGLENNGNLYFGANGQASASYNGILDSVGFLSCALTLTQHNDLMFLTQTGKL